MTPFERNGRIDAERQRQPQSILLNIHSDCCLLVRGNKIAARCSTYHLLQQLSLNVQRTFGIHASAFVADAAAVIGSGNTAIHLSTAT
ncbi:hypothetical protein ACN22W_33725 [Burkholderia theae]|uniref:hypothetical protein n=1 Tax=Burkholderia theae TaxID=3143496 RepID=UPI003AFB115A